MAEPAHGYGLFGVAFVVVRSTVQPTSVLPLTPPERPAAKGRFGRGPPAGSFYFAVSAVLQLV